MRIFVAGGSGVLGRKAIPLLAGAGHQVIATTRSAGKTQLLAELGASTVVLNALDRDGVLEAVDRARPDTILHLLTDLGSGDRASTTHLRITGTRHLVEAAKQSGVERVVAESISWVYQPGHEPAGECDPLDLEAPEPRRTTIRSIQSLEAAVQETPTGVVLRFGYLYGPDTWYSRQGLFALQAQQGQLHATETVASFIHINDAARAAVTALDWAAEYGMSSMTNRQPGTTGYRSSPQQSALLPRPQSPAVTSAGRSPMPEPAAPVSNSTTPAGAAGSSPYEPCPSVSCGTGIVEPLPIHRNGPELRMNVASARLKARSGIGDWGVPSPLGDTLGAVLQGPETATSGTSDPQVSARGDRRG